MAKLVRVRRKEVPISVLEMDDRTNGTQLSRALAESIEGEVRFGPGDRALYAQDAGNYRHPPIGVVLPKSAEDVVHALEVCRRFNVPVLSRGGGTSLAGQCCNHAVVFDFSKYMRDVIDIDVAHKRARVLPGAVLDDLNDATAKRGLVFGPDPATHNHCTLGGMIGNNSCGVHSIQSEFYGPGVRTEDHVHELDVITYDGLRMRVGATSDLDYERTLREGGRKAEIYRSLRALRDRYADPIRAGFPKIQRRVSGYNLPELLPENGFNVARALVGSEATCVTILEAAVTLGRTFPCRALLILGYPDIATAGDDVMRIRELDPKPIALEGIDRWLAEFVRRKGLHAEYLQQFPDGHAWLLVEFGGDTQEEANEAAYAAQSKLTSGRGRWPVSVVHCDRDTQGKVWQIREAGLGATAFVPGRKDEWPGWEDSAVPPEKVGPYLREMRRLFDEYDYQTALYGHLGQGCIHCRISFDLASQEGIDKYKRFTREAAETVVRFGGSLSGEHGDGQARSDLLPIMFSEEILQAFREFKTIWDPKNKMNPGRIVDPMPRDANLRLGADYHPWKPETKLAFRADEGDITHAALRCVGVGKCRREGGGVMCPSYMVTLEEEHSTRGRAHVLFEMLRGEEVEATWKSEPVKEALDLCLSCKGCKSDCPVNVDMALYKSEFLYHYYKGMKLRPRHAWAFGLIDKWARIGALAPALANWAARGSGLEWLAKMVVGMSTRREVPSFAKTTFRDWYRKRDRRSKQHEPRASRVLLWPDTFNNHFFPRTLAAAVEVLESAGVEVDIPKKVLCCGRPLYDYGMLDRAEKYWRKILDTLESEIQSGTIIVGLEPSCVAAFRDELLEVFPDDELAKKLSSQTKTLGEYLDSLENWDPPKLEGRRALYQGHCHHESVMGTEPEHRVLRRMGLALETPKTGCCGMAGAFGFEREHYDISVAAGERVLLPAVRDQPDDAIVVADGFSCRQQIEQLSDREALHLAEVVQLAMHQKDLEESKEKRPEAQLIHHLRPAELRPAGITAGHAAVALMSVVALGSAAYFLLAPLFSH